jgi:hypothetical protein
MKSWIDDLIGQPWSYERNCWWLVRHVFRTQYGIEMPEINIDDPSADNVLAISKAAHVSGWRPAIGRPRDRDIVLLRTRSGTRHVGVMVRVGGSLRLLHCEGNAGKTWPGVVWEHLDSVLLRYDQPEFWRHSAGA